MSAGSAARWSADRERGAVLLEFALVSFVLLVLLGALFDYGRAFYAAQQAQRAVQLAARELALLELPPAGVSLRDALACRRAHLADPAFPQCAALAAAPLLPREAIFDPDWLAFSCETLTGLGFDCAQPADLERLRSRLPRVNQLLWPLMVWDRSAELCPGTAPCLLRYPGALFADADPRSATGLTVRIPVLGPSGVSCVPVLEPLEDASGADGFGVERGGVVGLRLNYPFQSVRFLEGRAAQGGGPLEPVEATALACGALPAGLAAHETLGPLPVASASPGAGPHAGPLGLGRLLALGRELRPFRRVLASEALARRELFL